ncbi:MAG: hypothetical protein WCO06_01670 [Candidatus Roizmanbacteria bacterium]
MKNISVSTFRNNMASYMNEIVYKGKSFNLTKGKKIVALISSVSPVTSPSKAYQQDKIDDLDEMIREVIRVFEIETEDEPENISPKAIIKPVIF